ncbi:MAG: hypothetical protein IKV88_01910 [Clostridia bacterium]|nr:hypothetical protein [Clostridia bacterium]
MNNALKKFISSLIIISMVSVCAFAASFEIDDNPDYVSSITTSAASGSYYKNGKVNTFDDKSENSFYADTPPSRNKNSTFSWIEGASGEEDDWAPYLEVNTDAALNLYADTNDRMFFFTTPKAQYSDPGTLHLNYDIKINTSNDLIFLSDIQLWGTRGSKTDWILFGNDGKLVGTDYSYKVGEWFNMKMTLDIKSGLWNVWVDGEHVLEDRPKNANWWNDYSRIAFHLTQTTEKTPGEKRAGFAIDNLQIYFTGKDINEFVTVSYEDSENTEVSKLPVQYGKIVADFDKMPDSSLINNENIKLINSYGGEIPCEFEILTEGEKKVKILPKKKLLGESAYHLKISDEIRKTDSTYRPPLGTITVETAPSFKTKISFIEIFDKPGLSFVRPGEEFDVTVGLSNTSDDDAVSSVIVVLKNEKEGITSIRNAIVKLDGQGNKTLNLRLKAPLDFNPDLFEICCYTFDDWRMLTVCDMEIIS